MGQCLLLPHIYIIKMKLNMVNILIERAVLIFFFFCLSDLKFFPCRVEINPMSQTEIDKNFDKDCLVYL